MEGSNAFTKFLLDLIETFISLLTNGGEFRDRVVQGIFIVVAVAWVYSGIKLYLDARNRYKLNIPLHILILILGIITGPIGLIFYIFTRPKYTMEEVDFLRTEHKFYFQQASKVIECGNCGHYLPEGYEFCTNCGEQNRIRCSNCNNLTNLDDKYCFYCGYKFEENRMEEHLKSLGASSTAILPGDKPVKEENKPGLKEETEDTSTLGNRLGKEWQEVLNIGDNLTQFFKILSGKSIFDLNLKSSRSSELNNAIPSAQNVDQNIELKQEDEIVVPETTLNKSKTNKVKKKMKKSKQKGKKQK